MRDSSIKINLGIFLSYFFINAIFLISHYFFIRFSKESIITFKFTTFLTNLN